ncbi:hypothetical protein DEA8626_03698 [Defluviimonas aquaemixtae]|uniref:ABM domain-containing protein n=1 Tax=Albidovulum aquaemixtae TaxID=1542388 RepID=A0A2R8BMK7_9RHOB|nr:hypothetical protein [Defluviimonas aquaemixtae]SPH24647.1 hypothetical protein DEA8626_03698 [Defluviimonas aquaemixtae]
MTDKITVLAPFTLAKGKTEADLLAASAAFQANFVAAEPGVLRRELVRTGDGKYIDIVQFRSAADLEDVMEKEKTSAVCHAFFEVMEEGDGSDSCIAHYQSIATYP